MWLDLWLHSALSFQELCVSRHCPSPPHFLFPPASKVQPRGRVAMETVEIHLKALLSVI